VKVSDSLKASLGRLATRYNEGLDEGTLSYLADRGLGPDAVHGFRLGLVVDPDPLHEEYRGRLSIPYITPTGVVSMRFRCLEDHNCRDVGCPKYIQSKGEPTHIYNVQALHDADTIVGVCEGEIDAQTATLAGLPSVGIPGAENWKPFWYRLFQDFERVIVLGDGDKAGRGFASKLSHSIPGGEAKVLPEGMDVNSYVVSKGAEDFLSFIS
jgi:5S rRNA maturation endonuclease (ribonuclease M5)